MFEKTGHRGACGYEPENTLASFTKALTFNVDVIEGDVWLTKDNEVVFMHDKTVNRTTNGNGKVSNLNLAQIKTLTTKRGQQPIPTLQEVLSLIKNRCKINIEVKTNKVIKKVLEIIQSLNFPLEDVIISSSLLRPLKFTKKVLPQTTTAWIFSSKKTHLSQMLWYFFTSFSLPILKYYVANRLKKLKIQRLHLYYLLASSRFINFLHQNNIKVYLWTVNSPGLIKRYKQWGADGVISNYPDLLN